MYKQILDLLRHTDEWDSDIIDIAKGKYKSPQNYKDFKKQLRWRLKKQ